MTNCWNGSTGPQTWSIGYASNGRFQTDGDPMGGPWLCLGTLNAGTAAGTTAGFETCADLPTQGWTKPIGSGYTLAGPTTFMKNPAKCMTVDFAHPEDFDADTRGLPLRVADCAADPKIGQQYMRYSVLRENFTTATILAYYQPYPNAGADILCFEPKDGNTADGTPIITVTCNDTRNQLWNQNGSRMLNLGIDKCISTADGSLNTGTALVLKTCKDSDDQLFTWTEDSN